MCKTAWGDESIRSFGLSNPVYLLCASLVDGPEDSVKEEMERLKPRGAFKLHWRDMGDEKRMESVNAISAFDAMHIVIAAVRITGCKPERARRKCLERLLPILEQAGVERFALESRNRNEDDKDIRCWQSMRSKGMIETIRIAHAKGSSNPMLWIPDQVLGAYGDVLSGGTRYSEFVERCVLEEKIDV